ncbi:MAG: hypothetical protein HIU86_02945 [Acidobacteria bacterium]|nr:hypothetical protein [Acidobacteriota bacterium]
MQSFIRRSSRRAAIITAAAGLAVAGAVGVGTAAFADGTTPSPGTSQSAAPAPSGAPSGAPGVHGPGRTHAPHIGGTVQSVEGATVTVRDRDGFTRTIALQSGVTVAKGTATSSTAAITKGTWIEAVGTVDANGTTLDATTVSIGRPTPPKGGPAGRPAGQKGDRPAPPAGESRGPAPTTSPSAS